MAKLTFAFLALIVAAAADPVVPRWYQHYNETT